MSEPWALSWHHWTCRDYSPGIHYWCSDFCSLLSAHNGIGMNLSLFWNVGGIFTGRDVEWEKDRKGRGSKNLKWVTWRGLGYFLTPEIRTYASEIAVRENLSRNNRCTTSLYPLLCWWTFWLLPCCCSKHLGACVILNYGFLWVMLSSGIVGSDGSSIFSFLNNLFINFTWPFWHLIPLNQCRDGTLCPDHTL